MPIKTGDKARIKSNSVELELLSTPTPANILCHEAVVSNPYAYTPHTSELQALTPNLLWGELRAVLYTALIANGFSKIVGTETGSYTLVDMYEHPAINVVVGLHSKASRVLVLDKQGNRIDDAERRREVKLCKGYTICDIIRCGINDN